VSLPEGPLVLADPALAIDPDEVLRFQGYKRGRDVPGPDVRALFETALAEGRRLMRPRALVRWARVTRVAADALEVEGESLAIPRIGALWGEVEHAAVALCTIGEALEQRVAELWEARASTHNMYVMLASDFGLIGLLAFPSIVLAAMGSRVTAFGDAFVAALFLLFWGLFSHNILSEYYLLITISMIAALSRRESEAARHGTRCAWDALAT